MDTLYINLLSGPGAGKSTLAAELFAKLKWRGVEAELVTEYAKDLVWEKSYHRLEYQIGLFAEQHRRMARLKGQVEVVVTDSPLLLSLVYGSVDKSFHDFVLSEHNKLNNLNLFLVRNPLLDRYSDDRLEVAEKVERGREKAKKVDNQILDMLRSENIPYERIAVVPNIAAETICSKLP